MSKEVKTSGIKYLIFALIVILVSAYALLHSNTTNDTITIVSEQTAAEPNVAEKQISKSVTEEAIIGRIDISTPLVNVDEPQFEVYVDGSNEPEKQAAWMPKFDRQGYVVQKNGNTLAINLKITNDTSLRISLKGKYQLNENKQVMENWVKYTSVTINGEEILPEPTAVWHNKPFIHTINAKAGEEYKIHAEWQKPDTASEE